MPASSKSRSVAWTTGCSGGAALVVAVEGDVDCADLELDAASFLDQLCEPLRERDAAGVDADERDRLEVVVALDDLVRDPAQRAPEPFGIQQRLLVRPNTSTDMAAGDVRAHSAPFRSRWTGLKGRRRP